MSPEVLLRTCFLHRNKHRQTQTIDSAGKIVDTDIAPLLQHLQAQGHEALVSCQGLRSSRNFGHDGFIVFSTYESAAYCMKFLMDLEWAPLTLAPANPSSQDPSYMVRFGPLLSEKLTYDLRQAIWTLQQVS